MKDDLPEELYPDVTALLKTAVEAVELVNLKEFKNFHLGLNYEDPDCQELILQTRGKSEKEKLDIVFKVSPPLIKSLLTYQKKKELKPEFLLRK